MVFYRSLTAFLFAAATLAMADFTHTGAPLLLTDMVAWLQAINIPWVAIVMMALSGGAAIAMLPQVGCEGVILQDDFVLATCKMLIVVAVATLAAYMLLRGWCIAAVPHGILCGFLAIQWEKPRPVSLVHG